jgi:hypothetical protein
LALLLRGFLAFSGLAGALLLILATSATVIRISIEGTSGKAAGIDTTVSGSDRHGPLLVMFALVGLLLLAGGLRGVRPAMAGLAATGIVVLALAVLGDGPHLHDTGIVSQLYNEARSDAGAGFYLESLGGALLLIAGGGLLLLDTPGTTNAAPEGGVRPKR